jgi:hypothetical protein
MYHRPNSHNSNGSVEQLLVRFEIDQGCEF